MKKPKLQDSVYNMIPFMIKRKKEIYKCSCCIENFQKETQESVNRAYLCGNVIGRLGWDEEELSKFFKFEAYHMSTLLLYNFKKYNCKNPWSENFFETGILICCIYYY